MLVPVNPVGAITDREAISSLRRRLSAMGCEWDLMWSLERLEKELASSIRTKALPATLQLNRPILRYWIVTTQINRLVCYDRSLLVGTFKLRLTLSCPSAKRDPIAFESPQPFEAGRCLADTYFRIAIPVIPQGASDQLREWRLEFEVLHKFTAAPIYSVVARSWVDPEILAQTEALDIYSANFSSSNPSVCVRIELLRSRTSGIGINLFRTVSKAILFMVKMARILKFSREREVALLEKQMHVLKLRAVGEREQAQFALLNRTLDVMTNYIQSGSKPDDWVRAMQRVASDDERRKWDAQMGEMKNQIETLRNDVLKAVIDKPVQYVQQVPTSPAGEGGVGSWWNSLAAQPAPVTKKERDDGEIPEERITQIVQHPATAGQVIAKQLTSSNPPTVVSQATLPPATAAEVITKQLSASAPDVMAKRVAPTSVKAMTVEPEKTPLKKIAPRQVLPPVVEPQPAQVESAEVADGDIDQVAPDGEDEEQAGVEEEEEEQGGEAVGDGEVPVEDLATAAANTVNSWWGAISTAVGGSEPTPSPAATAKPVAPAVKKPSPKAGPPGKAALPVKPAPAKTGPKLSTAPLVSAVSGGKGKPVPKKPVVKMDPVKAKMMLVMKIKQLEMKRKAEIEVTNNKITELAKKLPPLDRSKFLGLPGPPPFAPKAKAKAEPSILPSALGPPPVDADADPEALMEDDPGDTEVA